jgi:hypothetical protein
MTFFMGLSGFPVAKIIRKPNDACHRTIGCYIFLRIPTIITPILMIIFTLAYDNHVGSLEFWISFIIYIYLYAFSMIYGELSTLNYKYHMRLFHPVTYVAIVLLFPIFLIFYNDPDQTKAIRDQDSVSTDDDMEDGDLEGFAEVKPAVDENIFEIYDRLTIHDQIQRSKTFRKTMVLRPIRTRTLELGGDDAPSLDDDVSRESEESKSDICAICKENKDHGQHVVTSFCDHEFHFKCLMNVMKTTKVCPICDQKLRPK